MKAEALAQKFGNVKDAAKRDARREEKDLARQMKMAGVAVAPSAPMYVRPALPAGYLSFGPIEKHIMFSVTSAHAHTVFWENWYRRVPKFWTLRVTSVQLT